MMPELIVDCFAGGGGASEGIFLATGRHPDIAINHDAAAVAMHRMNHPETRHFNANINRVDPMEATGGRPVGLAWFSPDCKHHSKAKGGKPVKRSIRDLAWVVVLWAKRVRPRIIMLENVEEFRDWGPLVERAPGEFYPCPDRKGETFNRWVGELRRLGYRVEWRELRACDYGAPTIRKRLFLIARRDGEKIIWPAPSHGKPGDPDVIAGKKQPWRTAAEIIDWSRPCHSIFLTREEGRMAGVNRPLADNTMARIAKGVKRYVLDAAKPFIVPITHTTDTRTHAIDDPLRTITTAKGGEHAIVSPSIVGVGGRMGQSAPRGVEAPFQTITAKADSVLVAPHVMTMRNAQKPFNGADEPTHTITSGGASLNLVAPYLVPRYGERPGQEPRARSVEDPSPAVVPTGNGASLVAAFMAQHNYLEPGHAATEPVSTIVSKGSTQAVVSAGMINMKGSARQSVEIEAPLRTICASTVHAAEVRAFVTKYYGPNVGHPADEPLHTATVKPRFGLVTVDIEGEPYAIVDIGMRMLTPRELFRAQGFGDHYIIDRGRDESGAEIRLTGTVQVAKCGNSVSPPMARALAAANFLDAAAAVVAIDRARAPLLDCLEAAA